MSRIAVAVVAGILGTAFLPANAQVKLDMNKITCKELVGYDQVNQNFVRYWMSGYYHASKNIDTVDLRRLDTDSKKVVDYCRRHKSDPLPKAVNKVAG